MNDIEVKEKTQEEQQELSKEQIKQDFNPHKQSSCAAFLRAYKSYFIKNFNKICKEKCTCDSCLNELGIDTEYYYDAMFNPDVDVSEGEITSLFSKLIHHSAQFDVVLNQAWLQMIDDYITGLRKLQGRVDEISCLVKLLNELFRMLDEAYYNYSKQVNIAMPDVDKEGDPYKRIISNFKRYVEDSPEGEDDFTGLKIHSFYHSTPLDMAATVEKVEEQSITFNVHPYISLALQKVPIAFISSPVHDNVYKAYAEHIDVKNRKVKFTSFISHDHDADNRKYVRVELSKVTRAMIVGKQAEAEGIIYDISEAACAVYVRNVNINNFETGSKVRFIVKLPDTSGNIKTEIDTMGTIYNSYKQGNNDLHAYRIVIQYDNEPAFFSNLANYISSRQREIIREMKDLSEIKEDTEDEEKGGKVSRSQGVKGTDKN